MFDHHVDAWRLHGWRLRISDVPRPTSKGPHMLVTDSEGVMRWVKRPTGYGIGEMSFAKLLGLGDDVSDDEAARLLEAGEITPEIAAKGHAETREQLKGLLERRAGHASKTASRRVTKAMLEEAYCEYATDNGNDVRDHLKRVKAYLLKRHGVDMKEETISAELHRHGIRKQAKRKIWPE